MPQVEFFKMRNWLWSYGKENCASAKLSAPTALAAIGLIVSIKSLFTMCKNSKHSNFAFFGGLILNESGQKCHKERVTSL